MMGGRNNILAIIPARGGSKKLPKKNIKILFGKPLISWTITSAKQSSMIDKVVVSTDDEEIAKVSKEYGGEVPFMRPGSLAKDDTPTILPILYTLQYMKEYETVIVLQPTSPLRTTYDINNSIQKYLNYKARGCVSITSSSKPSSWFCHLKKGERIRFKQKIAARRQDEEHPYYLNGAIYIANIKWVLTFEKLFENGFLGYQMPIERSIDIDTEFDLLFAEYILEQNLKEKKDEHI